MTFWVVGLFLLLFAAVFWIFREKERSKHLNSLTEQNRLLWGLRSLDLAALSNTEIEPLCQSIVDIINRELGFAFAVIILYDKTSYGLRRVAITYKADVEEIIKDLPIKVTRQVVPLTQTDNVLVKVFTQKKPSYIEDIYDIQRGIFSREISHTLQKNLHEKLGVNSFFLYPLVVKNEVIGVIEYPSDRYIEQVPKTDLTILEEFTNEVARVLKNTMLFQDLKLTTQKLEAANKQLKEVDKLKDDFLSVASHELRTPMTIIKSYVWMSLNESDIHLPDKIKLYLTRTLISTERLINLVNDMLDVSKMEQKGVILSPREVDIFDLTKYTVNEIKIKALEKDIDINILPSHSSIPKVTADASKVSQVLINLLNNAIKFTPRGGSINVSFSLENDMVKISIQDTGVGISVDEMPLLFQKFGRLSFSFESVATSGGTGLGLYICKNLVELMGGNIWVSSPGKNKGATFSFTLPIAYLQVPTHKEPKVIPAATA